MTVDFNPDAEQVQVIGAIEEMLAERFPLARFRAVGGSDHDAVPVLAKLGWLGLGVAEADGGAGLSLVEEAAMFRALGRHLVAPGMLAGVLGVHAALALGRPELAADIMAGKIRVALANPLQDGKRWSHAIYDGDGADHLLFWNAVEFTCVPRGQVRAMEPGRCLDRTVALLRATVAVGDDGVLAGEAARPLRARAELLVAAQLLGLAEAALATAVEYAKLRRQFGQPIGAFQAIKHRCADMKVRVNVLASLVTMAALAARERLPDAPVQIAAARLLASRYAIENAAAGVQIHGAMGFTAECDAHLFLLRAHLLDTLGTTAAAREAELAGLPA